MAEGEEETIILSAQDPVVCASQGLDTLGPPKAQAVEASGRAVARAHQWLCGQRTLTSGTGVGEEDRLQSDGSRHM